MPPKNRDAYNAYHRVYQLRRYHERMERFRQLLGGVCMQCGSTKNLHIDHIDPKSKDRKISHAWNWRDEAVLEELKKCQLLCERCHLAKHNSPHGAIRRYQKGCRCYACRAASAAFGRKYRQKRRAREASTTVVPPAHNGLTVVQLHRLLPEDP